MTPASGGHEATCEETVDAKLRLDTQKLLDHAAALSSAIDTANAAGWALRTEWLPFMQDVDNLALGLDKLGDGSLAKARRVRDAKERSTPSRTTSNADDLRVRELPVAAPKEPKRYATLLEELRAIPDYQPLLVLDTHMGITLQTSTPSNVRRSFFKDMSFEEFPVKLHIFVHGGPHPSNAYVWRIGLPLDLARDSAAQAHAVTHAPAHSSRAMLRDFFDRFASVGNSRIGLRAVYRHLLPDQLSAHDAKQEEVDQRCLKFLTASDDLDPTFFFDQRALNGPEGTRFESFWAQLGEYLQLEVGESAHERRHGVDAIAYASKIISIPVTIREVAAALHTKPGHENDRVPKEDCVRHQFTPNHPTHLAAGNFTGRYKVVRKVQTRCLRKEHEDAHYVAALIKYNKIRIVRVRDACVEAGFARGVLRAGLDDQKQMPVGPPGLPINSGARPHGPVLAPADQRLDASDHDSHRQGAIINSLTLLNDIPEHAGDSWYAGTPSLVLHCATFEKSDPFFHAAQLLQLLRTKEADAPRDAPSWAAAAMQADRAAGQLMQTFFLSLQTDGGADHKNTLLKVKLSLLALKRCLAIQRLDTERCAPSASASLVHERVFSLLNLGLQHTSFARPLMDDDLEAMVRSLSSMAEIRHAAGVGPPPKQKRAAPAPAGVASAEVEVEEAEAEAEAEMEDGEEDEEEEGALEVEKITAERLVKGVKQYYVEWADPDEEASWEPAANLASAAEKVEEWRRSRLSKVELEAELAAEAAKAEAQAALTVAQAQAQAAAKAQAEAEAAKPVRLREQFKAAIQKVIDIVKGRLTLLELKGKRVECADRAPPEVEAELHTSLRTLDAKYDPKYRLMSDLKKMPTIEAYLTDPEHTFDATYMLSYQVSE